MVPKADSDNHRPLTSNKSGGKKKKHEVVECCPSFRRGHLPYEDDVERLRSLTRPHVESFNYFLETGLASGIQDFEPAELDLVDPKKIRQNPEGIDWDGVSTVKFWVEDIKVTKPTKGSSTTMAASSMSGSSHRRSDRLLPRECRERSLVYSGQIIGKFCYQIVQRRNGVAMEGTTTKIPRTFGNMPIMVGSKACHLDGLTPKELVQLREEVCGKMEELLFYGIGFFLV
jgi:DNA-directed RNA polymerase I subunit RPA2